VPINPNFMTKRRIHKELQNGSTFSHNFNLVIPS
jgi:hypothetical protein